LQPLHSDRDRDRFLPSLSAAEVEALTRLGTTADGKLPMRFVQEALQTLEGTRRLRNRARFVWQAAVGLDSRRRDEAERLLVGRLTAEDTAPEARINLAFALAELGEVKPAAAARAVERLGQLMLETKWWEVSPAVLALAAYLDPDDVKKTAVTFLRVMGRTTGGYDLELAEHLVILAARLEPKDAAEVFGYAAAILNSRAKRANLRGDLGSLAYHLAILEPRLKPTDALTAAGCAQAAALLDRCADAIDPADPDSPTEALAALAPHLSADDARASASTVNQAMTRTTNPRRAWLLASRLVVLAKRLEPNEAAAQCGQAARTLNRVMARTAKRDDLALWTATLAVVAPFSGAEESKETAATIDRAIHQASDPRALLWLAEGLAGVAFHLEPKERADRCGRAVTAIERAMTEPADARFLAEGLSKLAPCLEPKNAAAALVRGMTKAPQCRDLSQALVEVAPRLERREAKELAVILARAMTQLAKPYVERAAVGLAALVARLDSGDAKEVAAVFARAIPDSNEPWVLFEGLQLVAERLEADEAKDVAARLADALTDLNNKSASGASAAALSAVAQRLTAGDATAILTRVMHGASNPDVLQHLANGLWTVAPRLGPKEAKEAATALTQAMIRAQYHPWWGWSSTLSKVAKRLDPEDAKKLTATLAQAMTKTEDADALRGLAEGLSAAATRLDADGAALPCTKAATILTQAMAQERGPSGMCALAHGLAEVATCLDQKQAAGHCARAGAILTQVMSRTREPAALYELAHSLRGVAERLEAKDAARLCTQAAGFLNRAITETTDPRELMALAQTLHPVAKYVDSNARKEIAATLNRTMTRTQEAPALESLADSLAAVVALLGPAEAAAFCGPAAATLTQTMCETEHPEQRRILGAALTAVLDREPIWQREHRLESACSRICLSTSPTALPLALALPDPALKPLPESLPAETLVELLRHPLCVGEARRAVLGALGRRYQRTFADQWEFVRFAEEQKLGLDLASPAKRP
jgi:hypothetical protein